MIVLLLLIPVTLLVLGIAVALFFWAVNHQQFDDLDTPAMLPLMEDDLPAQPHDAAHAGALTPAAVPAGFNAPTQASAPRGFPPDSDQDASGAHQIGSSPPHRPTACRHRRHGTAPAHDPGPPP